MNSKEYGQNMTLKQSKLDDFSDIICLVKTMQAEQGVFFGMFVNWCVLVLGEG